MVLLLQHYLLRLEISQDWFGPEKDPGAEGAVVEEPDDVFEVFLLKTDYFRHVVIYFFYFFYHRLILSFSIYFYFFLLVMGEGVFL